MPALSHQHGDDFVEAVRQSLYAAKIVAYAQGFSLYKSASETYDWHLDYGAIASIFRAGCIIQAEFLTKITEAYDKNPDLDNLLFDDFFLAKINANQGALRQIIGLAIANGLPIPAFSAALQYLDAYSSPRSGPTSSRPCATTSAPIRSSASIKKALSIIIGTSTIPNKGGFSLCHSSS